MNSIDKIIEENPYKGIVKIVALSEEISKILCEREELEYALNLNQRERLIVLNNEEVIYGEISRAFDVIRFIGNGVVNNTSEVTVQDGKRIGAHLKEIVHWANSRYDLELQMNLEIDNKVKEYKSSLFNQIKKLSDSSQEAVEGLGTFSDFKKYLHVHRGIQEELFNTINNCKDSKKAELILLCGNVGDGKSHLLSYLKNEYPDIISKFSLHNDATESFDPNKSSLDTLVEVLDSFSDDKVNKCDLKVIMAINLGVLYNFIESDIAKESFKKLRNFVLNGGVFDEAEISLSISEENFNVVSFADYNLYELGESGPSSSYIMELLDKITLNNEKNPFYTAYLEDIQNERNSIIVDNYKILMDKNVKNQIVQLIIRVMIENKKLISTRELLNFIYDLIVPKDFNLNEFSKFKLNMCEDLLPNLLFGNGERSNLLYLISKYDPINFRSKEVDEFLMKISISKNTIDILEDYIYINVIEGLKEEINKIESINEVSSNIKKEIIYTLLRSNFLLGKEIKNVFFSQVYRDYMNYLYYYNLKMPVKYKRLYEEVKEAIFKWNGSPLKEYVFLNSTNKNMKVAEKIDIRATINKKNEKHVKKINRFKNSIFLSFKPVMNDEMLNLNLDYSLYNTIRNILKGYCLNKKDKEDSALFVEFIDKVIENGDKNRELLIKDVEENLLFKFEYDEDFEIFSFKKVD